MIRTVDRPVQPLTLTVEQAAAVLGVTRSTAYELVRAGDIESIRLRRRIVVPVAQLAGRLGVTAAEVWAAVRSGPPSAGRPPRSTQTERSRLVPLVEEALRLGCAGAPAWLEE